MVNLKGTTDWNGKDSQPELIDEFRYRFLIKRVQ
ncbi:hypothetical protein T01_791 [Trichinella spiralis]|uniref:Uncharacterized protein n=1 Tax=Trichinella spiralis TaxID=6334 RepID=A0A0V0Z3C5_TRISP|nr:hypothetical protein T01_791 [Trichinella spiralis]